MHILLIRTGGVGDCILTLPVLASLRDRHPEAEIHVLGNGAMLDVARLAGGFASLRSIDEAGFSALFAGGEPTAFLRAFFSRFDRVYLFSAGDREDVRRIVLEAGAGDCRTLDPRPPGGFRGHIAGHLLSILDHPPAGAPTLPEVAADGIPARVHGRLVIHPGSGGTGKVWPLERFLEVAARWSGEALFLLGPAEAERGLSERIPPCFPVLRDISLADAFTAVSSAAVFLGCDSGMSHLAALARTPSIALFGPTDPAMWRPLGERTTVIVSPVGTMEGIGVDEVFEAVVRAASGAR